MGAIKVRAAGVVMTPEQIRDALLSIPDNDRKFIVTNPEEGKHPITNIVLDTDTDEQVVTTP